MAKNKYRLAGQEIEACDCATLCPCVLGDDPDHGGCVGILARVITEGEINGVDVSGLTWLEVFQSPGNMLLGNIRKIVYIDQAATIEQIKALRDAFEGRLGGPLEDIAKLTSDLIDVVQADVDCSVTDGAGRVAVTGKLRAVIEPRHSDDGVATTLRNSRFSTIRDSPAWLSRASELTVSIPEHGFQFTFEGRSAIEGAFRYDG
jgi:hypothetical protein